MADRTLTAAVEADIVNATTSPRWLVEIEFDSGFVRLWNGIGNLTALSQTWTGAGRLGSISPIRETQETVASGVEMTILIVPTPEMPDAPDQFLNIALSEDYQGRPVTIYQAQLNQAGGLIADPFVRFKGRLDVMEDTELPGGAILKITAENRLIDLERPRRRTYTPEDQRAFNPSDSFFDGVAALQSREIEFDD